MQYIQKTNFWDIVPENIRPELKRIGILKKYGSSEIVFHEDDSFRGFFIVESGKFKLYNLSMDGKEAIIHLYSPGDIISAMHIFLDIPRYTATAQALEAGSLTFFDTKEFKSILLKNPDFMYNFSGCIMKMMFALRKRLSSLLLSDVKDRLLHFLEEIGAVEGFVTIPIPKNQVALLIGTTPETLSRSLKILEVEELLEAKDGKYRLIH